MTTGGNRWWGARSDFPWERAALDFLKQRMPTTEPYRAWSNFTFTAATGHVREVDLLMVTPAGLFLVEIKSHPGRVTGQGGTWMFHGPDRVRTIDNPLHLADRKAKELKGQLEWAIRKLNLRGLRVPYVRAAVFLSDPGLRSELDEVQRLNVHARDRVNGLPAIWDDLLGAAPRSAPARGDLSFSRQLPKLMQAIGVAEARRHRTVGTWRLAHRSMGTGPTWEDYLAENTALEGDHRRVRLYLSELGASRQARESTRRAARREYLVLQGIDHPGIIKAEQFSDDHEAGPAIVFAHRPEWLRLDHYMAQYGDGLDLETRLDMIRQLAEALAHAHRRHLYHRALAARSVWVAFHGAGYEPRLRIGDWQAAARSGGASDPAGPGRASTMAAGMSSLAGHIERAAEVYLAPEFNRPEADSVPLDVFGLGALGYLVMTGRPPADERGELARRLAAEHALTPSAVDASITPRMDELVTLATQAEVCDRLGSVREFLEYLDLVEEELTAPDPGPDLDPLEAVRGTVVGGWTVQRNLGKGSTARAFLAERRTADGKEGQTETAVLKVALSDAAADRLHAEADLLARLHDSHIVRLLDGPLEAGDRTLLVVEHAGETTLAEYLRRDGRLSPDELERFGDHLFSAVDYLDGEGLRHRDLKPDNLGIRRLANNSRRLVLFDFSMADAPDEAVRAGTTDYIDPFVGTDRRPRYDDHAERYALAVTLHEMASADLPSWGDGMSGPEFIDSAETVPQLAEDRFDAGLRDGLVAFFQRALHRDASRRFASLKQMRDAWRDMFRELDSSPPPSIPSSTDDDADVLQARNEAAKAATAQTLLAEAGLSPRALSAAVDGLGVATVGELIALPSARVQRLSAAGVGAGPRNELLRRSREWRRRLQVAERPRQDGDDGGDVPVAGASDVKERLRRLTLDDLAGRLVPKTGGDDADLVYLALALPSFEDGAPSPVEPWAPQREIADHAHTSASKVASALKSARKRWTADPAVKPLRDEVVEILAGRGRVLEAGQLAAELLARRGTTLVDPHARLAMAGAAVRAAIETEERLTRPRLAHRRIPGSHRVIVALTVPEDADGSGEQPEAVDLIDYAQELGDRADRLAELDPLPSAATVRTRLREVVAPPGLEPPPDSRLVALAAAVSAKADITSRLELYPVDLDPQRAIVLAQIDGYLGGNGIRPDDLRRRVLARFPRLRTLPDENEPSAMRRLLQKAGYPVEWAPDGKRLFDHRYARGPRTLSGGGAPSSTTVTAVSGRRALDEVTRRLTAGVEYGGFLALKSRMRYAPDLLPALTALPDVTAVDVTAEFVTALRRIVADWGVPSWDTMLEADPQTAPPVYGELIGQALRQVETTVRTVDGIALLHDATPLSRYREGAAAGAS